MNKLPVAVQLYSVRDAMERDVKGTLQQIKQMGYDGVEFASLHGVDPAAMREMLEEIGLVPVARHLSMEEWQGGQSAIDLHKVLGCQYMVIPYLSEEYRPGGASFESTLEQIRGVGKLCSQNGIPLLYHNHEFEFDLMPNGQTGLDYMYQVIPADVLQTELDLCWVAVAGKSPVKYLERYRNRCPLVHVKDYSMDGTAMRHQPLGRGTQDIPGILDAAVQCGAKWVVVEQDEPEGEDSLDVVRISREYLRTLGW